MQNLKKSCVLLLGIFTFSSCGSLGNLPKKPQVEICAHDVPNAQSECYDSQTEEYRSLPINDTDRYIMYSPDDWGLILLYIEKLERVIKNKKVKKELRKILNTSKLHNPKNLKSNKKIY